MYRLVAQLPPLEITLCQFCDNLIPLNMLNIHQVFSFPKYQFTTIFIRRKPVLKPHRGLKMNFQHHHRHPRKTPVCKQVESRFVSIVVSLFNRCNIYLFKTCLITRKVTDSRNELWICRIFGWINAKIKIIKINIDLYETTSCTISFS
jgi:hypothetical protein